MRYIHVTVRLSVKCFYPKKCGSQLGDVLTAGKSSCFGPDVTSMSAWVAQQLRRLLVTRLSNTDARAVL